MLPIFSVAPFRREDLNQVTLPPSRQRRVSCDQSESELEPRSQSLEIFSCPFLTKTGIVAGLGYPWGSRSETRTNLRSPRSSPRALLRYRNRTRIAIAGAVPISLVSSAQAERCERVGRSCATPCEFKKKVSEWGRRMNALVFI